MSASVRVGEGGWLLQSLVWCAMPISLVSPPQPSFLAAGGSQASVLAEGRGSCTVSASVRVGERSAVWLLARYGRTGTVVPVWLLARHGGTTTVVPVWLLARHGGTTTVVPVWLLPCSARAATVVPVLSAYALSLPVRVGEGGMAGAVSRVVGGARLACLAPPALLFGCSG